MSTRFRLVAPTPTPEKIPEPGQPNPHLSPTTHPPHDQEFSQNPEVISQVGLSVDLAPHNEHHLIIRNPVMIASGTFGYDGYGRGMTSDMDLGRLGAVIPKDRYPVAPSRQPRAPLAPFVIQGGPGSREKQFC